MDKSLQKFNNSLFAEALTSWYEANKRDLPWRESRDPYRVWVSEIMLQQTKVDTVIDYYKRFLTLYPTVFHLAEAEEQEVLKVWEGLGYYSRARNLHQAAKTVVETHNGVMPNNPKELGDLKGIGPYTKGAISSIAFGHPEPAVDGNVMRVLSRVLAITDNISDQRTRKRFEHIVRELIMEADPSAFNQGLMELGALVCTPKKPACLHCPVRKQCRALAAGNQEELPVKLKKKKQRLEKYVLLLLEDQSGRIAIEKRPNKGLLANMWQFPMVDQQLMAEQLLEEAVRHHYHQEITLGDKIGEVNHIFSHIIWDLDVYRAKAIPTELKSELVYVLAEELEQYPFSVSHLKARAMLEDAKSAASGK